MGEMSNYERVQDIHCLFRTINHCKQLIKAGEQAKEEYADAVNRLLSVGISDSQEGEKLSFKALGLAKLIENIPDAKLTLEAAEEELRNRYGFLDYQEDVLKVAN